MSTALYWVQYLSSGNTPSGAQIVGGQDATGASALAYGNVPYTGTGIYDATSVSTTLSAGTSYVVAWVAFDGTNYSSVVISSPITVLTVSHPNGDVSTSGWTFNGSSFSNSINESVENDSTYAQSSFSTNAVITTLDLSLLPGTYSLSFAGQYLTEAATSGQFRFTLMDTNNTSLGVSSWQAVTSSIAQYTIPVTISGGTAVRLKIEIQP